MVLANLRRLLAERATVRKLVSNSGWLLADQMLRVGAGAFLNLWIARHFGPERLGAFNYAMAVVALWAPIAAFSLEVLLIRDLVKFPDRAQMILSSAFALRFAAGVLSILGAMVMVIAARPGENELVVLVLIAALATLFQAAGVVDSWFQSQVQAKYSALTRNLAFIVSSVVKIAGVLMDADIAFLSCAVLAEAAMSAFLYQRFYRVLDRMSLGWSAIEWKQIRAYLFEARSLVLTGILIGIYMRVDRLMIGSLLGNRSVGIYSVAVQLCELFYLLPTAAMGSIYPILIKLHAENEQKYRKRLLQSMACFFYGGLAIAVLFALNAGWLIHLLLGGGYQDSVAVVRVYIFLLPLIGMSIVFSHWYVLYKRTEVSMYGSVIGGASAVILNYLLIDRLGLIGSAYAALVSMVMPTIAVSLFFDRRVGTFFLDSIRLKFERSYAR